MCRRFQSREVSRNSLEFLNSNSSNLRCNKNCPSVKSFYRAMNFAGIVRYFARMLVHCTSTSWAECQPRGSRASHSFQQNLEFPVEFSSIRRKSAQMWRQRSAKILRSARASRSFYCVAASGALKRVTPAVRLAQAILTLLDGVRDDWTELKFCFPSSLFFGDCLTRCIKKLSSPAPPFPLEHAALFF